MPCGIHWLPCWCSAVVLESFPIDIMEMIGGQGREAEVHGTVHWNRGGLGAPYSHTYIGGKTRKAVGDFADGFNVFSLVRTEDQIEWYVNDELYYSFAINDSADLAPFRKPFFLIFNIAVGGNWPGYPDASTQFPQRLVVDYVRVFDAVTDSPGECNPCFPNSGEGPSSGEAASRFSQLTGSVTSEEILVIENGEARWLDDHPPHVRQWRQIEAGSDYGPSGSGHLHPLSKQ